MPITLTWLPHWRAYAVRQGRHLVGLIRLEAARLPFAEAAPVRFS
jgi:hypothetical protein